MFCLFNSFAGKLFVPFSPSKYKFKFKARKYWTCAYRKFIHLSTIPDGTTLRQDNDVLLEILKRSSFVHVLLKCCKKSSNTIWNTRRGRSQNTSNSYWTSHTIRTNKGDLKSFVTKLNVHAIDWTCFPTSETNDQCRPRHEKTTL